MATDDDDDDDDETTVDMWPACESGVQERTTANGRLTLSGSNS